MDLLTIDETKCKRDGLCAAECPIGLIEVSDKTKLPKAKENAEALCVRCGHCVAVCPHGALALRGMHPEDCSPVDDRLRPSAAQAEYFLRSRRSIRSYKDKPVGRETIERLIDIARYAPSAHNNQLTEWLVVYDKNDVRKYASMVVDWMRHIGEADRETADRLHTDLIIRIWESGHDRICRNAPHVVVAHGPEDNPMLQTTCTIALTYLELAAASLNVGACWAGYFYRASVEWAPMKEALGLPAGNAVFGAMMLGYPRHAYRRIPLRKEARVIWK
jgi:nitroreductase/NAD-dependent dihydropyrimidine dehydrogenase PreA subunit